MMERGKFYLLYFFMLVSFLSNFLYGNGLVVTFNQIASSLKRHFIPIRFVIGGNHYTSVLFITHIEDVDEILVDGSGNQKHCFKKLHGIYWSHGRPFAFFPLTIDELNILRSYGGSYRGSYGGFYDKLSLTGGFYTACSGNHNSVYGYIKYQVQSGTHIYKRFVLGGGLELNLNNNFVNNKFTDNLQYINGHSLFGFIIDSVGGIGVIGTNDTKVDNIVQYLAQNCKPISKCVNLNQKGNFVVSLSGSGSILLSGNFVGNQIASVIKFLGPYNITRSIDASARKLLIENIGRRLGSTKQYNIKFGDILSMSKFLNRFRREAFVICRGKRQKYGNYRYSNDDDVICIDLNGTNKDLIVKAEQCTSSDICIKNKTLIVKDGNVLLTGNSLVTGYTTIFIDKGVLKIDINDLVSIDGKGSYSPGNGVTSGVYLNANLIVRGLIWGTKGGYKFPHKLYIHGRVLSFNTLGVPVTQRIDLLNSLIGVGDIEKIDLEQVFIWRCNPVTGRGTEDGANCSNPNDEYNLYPLIVIYKKIPTSLFNY